MYTAAPNGDVESYAEFRNAHGGAMAVWRILSEKYLNAKGPAFMMLMMQGFKPLFDMHKQGKLEPWEAVVLTTTYDKVFIPIEHVASVASAFEKFVEENAEYGKQFVFSIPEQAKNLRFLLTEVEEKGWRGIGWNQNSVSEAIWTGQYGLKEDPDEHFPYNIDRDTKHWVWPEDKGDEEDAERSLQ
jgi:hypothetical protein